MAVPEAGRPAMGEPGAEWQRAAGVGQGAVVALSEAAVAVVQVAAAEASALLTVGFSERRVAPAVPSSSVTILKMAASPRPIGRKTCRRRHWHWTPRAQPGVTLRCTP